MQTGTLYFVLREGETREEQWSWEEIEALCCSGELTAGARIFLPDEDRWARLDETRLADTTAPASPRDERDDDRERLESEYQQALERVDSDEDALEALLDAGILAAQLDRRDEARQHFQKVLHRYPYHSRAGQEVKRRFSAAEQRTFRYLERPEPAWEDLGEVAAMPLARGPLYVAIPAAAFCALTWVPLGGVVIAALALLWCFQVMEYTARGATRPPEWNRALKDPIRKLARPLALMTVVIMGCGLAMAGVAEVMVLAGGGGEKSIWSYLTGSPVFVVATFIIGLLYMPAALVSIGGFTDGAGKTLDPRNVVKMVLRMEHEYVYTALLLAVIVCVVAVTRAATAEIPVLGRAVFGGLLAYATPMAGLLLGRLLGRNGHVIS